MMKSSLIAGSFYRSLLEWQVIDEIMAQFGDHEHNHVCEMLSSVIETTVLQTVLRHLPDVEHESFLVLYENEYHDEALLDWLEEKILDVRAHILLGIQDAQKSVLSL